MTAVITKKTPISPVAHPADDRAPLASGTVKNRIRMCGSAAVPIAKASATETVSRNERPDPPGAR
jgi:hypothetical protein